MTRRREQLVVVSALAALWALFAIQAWQTPTLLDDWAQLGWLRGRGLSLDLIWQVGRYNYLHGNPRIGDVFLLLVNGPRALHIAITPLAQLTLLWAAFVVAFGRRPALALRDLALALVLQVLIWLASPLPGVLYFYRPFATNYLFAFAATLCLLAPYRLALARPAPGPARWWWPPALFALGWLAGMGNEHTGAAAIAAVAGCIFAARRRAPGVPPAAAGGATAPSGGATSGVAVSGGAVSGGAVSGGAVSGGAVSGGAVSGGATSGVATTGRALSSGAASGGGIAWMLAGLLGLGVGYAMLLLAPGQAERYAGRAGSYDALGLVASRGFAGCYDIVTGFLGEVQWAVVLVVAAALAFIAYHRRRGVAAPGISRGQLGAFAALLGGAGAIVATLFASPVAIERLLFAPAVLVAAALAVIVEHLFALRRLRVAITVVAAAIFAYHAVRFVEIYAGAYAEHRQRIAALTSAAPGSIASVAAYRTPRSRWYFGDDFRMAGVREYVAHQLYGLDGLELSPRPIWAEPTPPERFAARRIYDPPLLASSPAASSPAAASPAAASPAVASPAVASPAAASPAAASPAATSPAAASAAAASPAAASPAVASPAVASPAAASPAAASPAAASPAAASSVPAPTFPAPSFLDAALDELRRGLAVGGWDAVGGHRLVGYQIDATATALLDPLRRPVRMVDWTPSAVRYVYGDGVEDAERRVSIHIAAATAATAAPGWRDAFVVACGRTTHVEPAHSGSELVLPLTVDCRGTYTAYLCDPGVCWFAGRFWR